MTKFLNHQAGRLSASFKTRSIWLLRSYSEHLIDEAVFTDGMYGCQNRGSLPGWVVGSRRGRRSRRGRTIVSVAVACGQTRRKSEVVSVVLEPELGREFRRHVRRRSFVIFDVCVGADNKQLGLGWRANMPDEDRPGHEPRATITLSGVVTYGRAGDGSTALMLAHPVPGQPGLHESRITVDFFEAWSDDLRAGRVPSLTVYATPDPYGPGHVWTLEDFEVSPGFISGPENQELATAQKALPKR
jgi:hypothetical protein